jgi:DNA-binding transcriptional regulator LsrR (DeoR family)
MKIEEVRRLVREAADAYYSSGKTEVTRMAKRLNMSQPGVAYAVKKGEKIVKDNDFQMIV